MATSDIAQAVLRKKAAAGAFHAATQPQPVQAIHQCHLQDQTRDRSI
jgi:hypothetical protein